MEIDALELLRMEVVCDSTAPATVRQSVGRLQELGWVAGDAMLVASELVNNAVMHSGGTPADVIEVGVYHCPDGILISVSDPGRSGKTAEAWPDHLKTLGGLGLVVVDALAERWGSERREEGYRVWAELGHRVEPGSGSARAGQVV